MNALYSFFDENIKGNRIPALHIVDMLHTKWKPFSQAVHKSFEFPVPSLKGPFLDRVVLRPVLEAIAHRYADGPIDLIEKPEDFSDPKLRKFAMLFADKAETLKGMSLKANAVLIHSKYYVLYDREKLVEYYQKERNEVVTGTPRDYLEVIPAAVQGVFATDITDYNIQSVDDFNNMTGDYFKDKLKPMSTQKNADSKKLDWLYYQDNFESEAKPNATTPDVTTAIYNRMMVLSRLNYRFLVDQFLTDDDALDIVQNLKFDSKVVERLIHYITTSEKTLIHKDTIVNDLHMAVNQDNSTIIDSLKQIEPTKTIRMVSENVCLAEIKPTFNYTRADIHSGVPLTLTYDRPASQFHTMVTAFELPAGIAMYDNSYPATTLVADKTYKPNEALGFEEYIPRRESALEYYYALTKSEKQIAFGKFLRGSVCKPLDREMVYMSDLLPDLTFFDNLPIGEIRSRVEQTDQTFLPLSYERTIVQWFVNDPDSDEFDKDKSGWSFELVGTKNFVSDQLMQYVRSLIGSKVVRIREAVKQGTAIYKVSPRRMTLSTILNTQLFVQQDIEYREYMYYMQLLGRDYDVDIFQKRIMITSQYSDLLKEHTSNIWKLMKSYLEDRLIANLLTLLRGTKNLPLIEYKIALEFLRELLNGLTNREVYYIILKLQEQMLKDGDVTKAANTKSAEVTSLNAVTSVVSTTTGAESTVERAVNAIGNQLDSEDVQGKKGDE